MNTAELKKLQAEITQGKWSIGSRNTDDNTINIGVHYNPVKQMQYIAHVSPMPHYADTQEANAQAIVLVPKLLAQNIELREALKEVVNQLTTLRSEYYRQGVTLKNEQVNMGSAALLQAKAALAGEK